MNNKIGGKKSSWSVLKRLFSYVYPYKKQMIFAMVSMSVVSLLTAVLAYIVKPLINDIFISKNVAQLIFIPMLVVGIFIVKGIFYYMEVYYTGSVGQNIIRTLRNDVYKAIVNYPVSVLNKIPTGVLIARIIYDINLVQRTVADAVSAVMKDVLTVIMLLGVIIYMDFYLAIVVFVLFPIAIIPVSFLGKKTRKTSVDTQNEVGNITKFLDETIAGLRMVKAYNMQDFEVKRFNKRSDNLYKFLMRMTKIRGLTVPFVELIGGISVAAIIFIGGYQVIKFGYAPGNFFSFLTAILLLYEPVKSLSRLNNTVQEGIAAGTRVFDIIDGPSEEVSGGVRFPENIQKLEMKNIYFSYNIKNGYDLKNINISVEKGRIAAIVGRSGAGKSTISMLIPRFYSPSSGNILINELNINSFNLKELRANISFVSQQVVLFNESVKFNISYGSPDAGIDNIINAAKLAYAHDFIMNLPQGYDTIVDEAGLRLSGGEKQRILMARAFLKNAPILILDEATASLDTESERYIQKALFSLCSDKIAIIIAHRLSTVKNVDTIYVLEKGEILEKGTHEELLDLDGIYKNLLVKQML